MKIRMLLWQRVVCALLALGGAAALVIALPSGGVGGWWGAVQWLLAACGIFAFAVIAIRRDTVSRSVESLPAPSAQVGHLVDTHQPASAIKACRRETGPPGSRPEPPWRTTGLTVHR